jgi:catalase-peroxidase
LGQYVPAEALIWQDPIPAVNHALIDADDIQGLKATRLNAGLTMPAMVRTAWASAASLQASDRRGGANGARLRLAPQKDWAANNPVELAKVLEKMQAIQADFNASRSSTKPVSRADIIVLGGAAAIEQAAQAAGVAVALPVTPGRADTTQAQTDVQSCALLEPKADAFRNYCNQQESYRSPVDMLMNKADQLNLTIPEMTMLVGGLRVLDANTGGLKHGVCTNTPGQLTNDCWVNWMDMSTKWHKANSDDLDEGMDRNTDQPKYTATSVDLGFGSNFELRAITAVYAFDNAQERFVRDCVKAWVKVMQLDRFDL